MYWSSFPGDREEYRLRGRSYRSEVDILVSILEVLNMLGRPVRKTRLVQYANLNTKSFSKYIELLQRTGLVKLTGEGFTITGRGRLALRVMEALNTIITPPPEGPEYRDVAETLCRAARSMGYECMVDEGLYDVVIEAGGSRVGIHVNSCEKPEALGVVASLVDPASAPPSSIKGSILCVTKGRGAPLASGWSSGPHGVRIYQVHATATLEEASKTITAIIGDATSEAREPAT